MQTVVACGLNVFCSVASVLVASACGTSIEAAPSAETASAGTRHTINTAVFRCAYATGAPFEFTVRSGPGELALWLPFAFERPYLVLSQSRDDRQEYRENDVTVRLRGQSADLAVGTQRFSACVEDAVRSAWEHAKLSGVDYRATGTGPDWYLEIRNGVLMEFGSAWRDTYIKVDAPRPDVHGDETVYRAEAMAGDLEVRIRNIDCDPADGTDMQGSSVTVWIADRVFYGCGRPLH